MLSPISELTVFINNSATTNSVDKPIAPPVHAYFHAESEGFVLDLASGADHQITLTHKQLCLYCAHDLALKSGEELKHVSAGYTEFADNFNNDPLYPVMFVHWNTDSTAVVATGVAAIFDPLFIRLDNNNSNGISWEFLRIWALGILYGIAWECLELLWNPWDLGIPRESTWNPLEVPEIP
ncbi:hypothetical protein BD779DRAFT_1479608 [Infundibulicybe gibba]|nr:hypothetical protein BD779DRAFT_1479608 [Infundibulicybe gibba]